MGHILMDYFQGRRPVPRNECRFQRHDPSVGPPQWCFFYAATSREKKYIFENLVFVVVQSAKKNQRSATLYNDRSKALGMPSSVFELFSYPSLDCLLFNITFSASFPVSSHQKKIAYKDVQLPIKNAHTKVRITWLVIFLLMELVRSNLNLPSLRLFMERHELFLFPTFFL